MEIPKSVQSSSTIPMMIGSRNGEAQGSQFLESSWVFSTMMEKSCRREKQARWQCGGKTDGARSVILDISTKRVTFGRKAEAMTSSNHRGSELAPLKSKMSLRNILPYRKRRWSGVRIRIGVRS